MTVASPRPPRVRAAGDPARAEKISDASREHVVHRYSGDDHLEEAALSERGVGDPAPARRLEPVDDAHAGDGADHRERADALGACPTPRRGRFRGSRARGRRPRPGSRPQPRRRASGSGRSPEPPACAGPQPRARRTSRERRSRSKHRYRARHGPSAGVAGDPSPWSRQARRPAREDSLVSSRTQRRCPTGVRLQSDTGRRGRRAEEGRPTGVPGALSAAPSRRAPSRSSSSAWSESSSSRSSRRRSSSATRG